MREKIARAIYPFAWQSLDNGNSKAGSNDHHDCSRAFSLSLADAVLDAMEEPTEGMIEAAWNNLPAPYEIDIEDKDAMKKCLAAVIRAAKSGS